MNQGHNTQNPGSGEILPNAAPVVVQPATGLSRWRNWLGLERNIVVMLVAILILGMGEELWMRFVPKYLELLGASAWSIAVYGTLKDLLDAIYQYPGGWLADRLGRRAALVLFTVLAIVGYVLYLLSPHWEWILIGTFFVMAWSSLTLPAIFAIIGDNLPQTHRAIGFGVQSILKRVPIVVAPLIGGWFIASLGLSAGMRLGLGITIVLALVAIIIVWRYYMEKAPSARDTARFGDVWRSLDAHLKRLLVADCLARWAEGIPKVFIVLYVINVLRADAFQFGWLISVQMLAATLIYIPIAKLSDRMSRKPFVLMTFAFFALFPLALVSAANFFWLVLAFVMAGLREIGEPVRKALIVDLAKETARGRAIGVYYLIRGLVVFPASLIGGWLWTINNQWPFYIAFMVGVAGFLAYAVWGPSERLPSPSQDSLQGGER
ncbi:MAG: MFS transporter [Acidobacteria bacterium]|nr:MFS transporter [Acidobacteriota bacterium]